jgi:DNA mismatch repair protein MutL
VVAPGSYNDRVEEALKRYRISSGPQKLYFGGQPGRSSEPPSFFPERQTYPAMNDDRAPAIPERPADLSELSKIPAGTEGINNSTPEQPCENVPDEGDAAAAEHYFASLLYLGQVEGTYLVFAGEEGLVIIDQHAAHERVLFEKMRRQAEAAKERGTGQRLLLPEVMSLPPRELSFLVESIPILADVGMEIEPFGGDSVVVKSVPAFFAEGDVRTMLADLLSECGGVDKNIPLLERRDRIFASLACRGAIKANQRMTAAEAESLCRELDRFPGIATCPHGRPLKMAFSKYALEKLFKRR